MANFFGAPGANDIRGTAEADQATLAEGTGTAFLREGNDEVWATTAGYHIVGLGAGNDIGNLTGEGTKIGFFGAGNDQAWLNVGQVFMGDGQDFLTFVNAFNTTSSAYLGRGNDIVEGSDGQQIIGCGPEGYKTLNLQGGDDIVYTNNADVEIWGGAGREIYYFGENGNKIIADFMVDDDTAIFSKGAFSVEAWDNPDGQQDAIRITGEFGNVSQFFLDDLSDIVDDLGLELNDEGYGIGYDFDADLLNIAFAAEPAPAFM